MKALHISVTGIVQGVGFRYYTQQKAMGLGICGRVENKQDGSVEIVAEGGAEALRAFLKWCHSGPNTATVEQLMYNDIPTQGYTHFEIKRSYT